MAIYFFHLRDGGDLLLDPGRALDDMAAIVAAALVEARAILSAEALTGRIDLEQRIEVENREGDLVHRLRFADAVRIAPPLERPATD